jgi:hypothetical protein
MQISTTSERQVQEFKWDSLSTVVRLYNNIILAQVVPLHPLILLLGKEGSPYFWVTKNKYEEGDYEE